MNGSVFKGIAPISGLPDQKGKRPSFFEKKKQKTSVRCRGYPISAREEK
jgi:hypothetical protein